MKHIVLIIILSLIAVFLAGLLFLEKKTERSFAFHDSYFSTQEISEHGFAEAKETEPIPGVIGILVNHHLLAPNFIAEEFLRAKDVNPDLVVILSPNHFTRGDGVIIMPDADWRTPYSTLEGAHRLIQKLAATKTAFIDELPFDKEHGVSGIVPFIKKMFPETEVLPVIFKTYATKQQVQDFIDQLVALVPKKTLFVCSFDFSHDSLPSIAVARDAVSVPIVEENNLAKFDEISVDSKPGIYACMYAMSKYGATFHLDNNTNSSVLIHNPSQPDTTSYITGYYK